MGDAPVIETSDLTKRYGDFTALDNVSIMTRGKLRAFGTQAEIMREIKQRRTFEIQILDAGRTEEVQRLVADAIDGLSLDDVSASETEALVRFDTDLGDGALSSLLTHLVDKRMTIAQFREVPTDLEDAFLSVTSQESGEPASDDSASVSIESEMA